MMHKIKSVVVLVVSLAAFVAPTAVSGKGQVAVVKLSPSKDGGGPVYRLGRVSKEFPIQAPQDIGPVCPPGTACVNQ